MMAPVSQIQGHPALQWEPFFFSTFFFFFNQAARIYTLPCLCFHSPQWFFHSVNRKDILPNPSKAASLMEKHSISRCSTTVSTKEIKAEMCRFCTTGVATSVANCFSKTVLQPCFHLSFFGHSGSLIPGELVFFFSVGNENSYNSLISSIYWYIWLLTASRLLIKLQIVITQFCIPAYRQLDWAQCIMGVEVPLPFLAKGNITTLFLKMPFYCIYSQVF